MIVQDIRLLNLIVLLLKYILGYCDYDMLIISTVRKELQRRFKDFSPAL